MVNKCDSPRQCLVFAFFVHLDFDESKGRFLLLKHFGLELAEVRDKGCVSQVPERLDKNRKSVSG